MVHVVNPGADAALDDFVLPFALEGGMLRGRILRLGAAADRAIAHHGYDEKVTALLGEAVALAALFGASLKFSGTVTIQTSTSNSHVRAVVADFITPGSVRGMASVDPEQPDAPLMGKGSFAVTIDPDNTTERYQGVVELGASLTESALTYFSQSEQIPTALRIAAGQVQVPGEAKPRWRAGGLMIQLMPGEGGQGVRESVSDDDWRRIEALVATIGDDELIDPQVTPEQLAWRLFHEDEVRVFAPQQIGFGCRCSRERLMGALKSYDAATLNELANDGRIVAACEFCGTNYSIDPAEFA